MWQAEFAQTLLTTNVCEAETGTFGTGGPNPGSASTSSPMFLLAQCNIAYTNLALPLTIASMGLLLPPL